MPGLPSGTVTFLFTDIEGSTSRWERQPEAMRPALARHDAIIRTAVESHGGYVVKTMGDAFHAAFSRAKDGVMAAIDAQRRLQAQAWEEIEPLRVRMALHTGAAEERDGDYYGPPVNRAARLTAAGHGGQILLSEMTAELVRSALPSEARLLDLGQHRLKDLTQPEHVFQIVATSLASEFPPLASLNARSHNLPIHPTVLLGRERELADIRALFENGARLVTLTGPGGTGKTRLSLQVAAELLDAAPSPARVGTSVDSQASAERVYRSAQRHHSGYAPTSTQTFVEGAYFVDLAPIFDPALIAPTIAQVFGMLDLGGRPVLESLKEYLGEKRILLVLDNFEQVVAGAATIAELLTACPGLKALATSREPLRLRSEVEYAVPPLSLPVPGDGPTPESLGRSAAVSLFVERAAQVHAGFSLTTENAPSVAQICRRLDGLPLAIELAAARARTLTPQAIASRLEGGLGLLTGGAHDLPDRQRTLRDTIAWSHDLLDERERRLFRRLAVFVDGWTFDAAEAICDLGDSDLDTLDSLDSLILKSLVRQDGDEPRFRMLETIRAFASDQLESSGEWPLMQDRHLDQMLDLAEAADAKLRGPDQAAWFDRLARERGNLRAALAWSCSEHDPNAPATIGLRRASSRVEAGVRLAKALHFFWTVRGRGRENLPHVTALAALAPPGTPVQGDALTLAAYVRGVLLGDFQAALAIEEESLRLWRSLGDRDGIIMALLRRGQILFGIGDLPESEAMFEEALTLAGNRAGEVRFETPVALPVARAAFRQGDHTRSQTLFDEALADARERGDVHGMATVLRDLARFGPARTDHQQAVTLLRESLTLIAPLEDVNCAVLCVAGLAVVSSDHGAPAATARLLGASEALQKVVGRAWSPAELATRTRCLASVEQRLTPAAFQAAYAEGEAMSVEQAIACALDAEAP